ncbi:MAG: glucose-6-phosphate dehydrogenase [Candidatus Omnitrophica bacterium]|nr:glucose-6-phosphate dehydrogenase [Candidatus Omnitrophota bacterium]
MTDQPVSIIVLGASGDLARKKIFPALFALYCQKHLPDRFHIVGFARTEMDQEEFRNKIIENLTCRYSPGESCGQRMEEFLARCEYFSGEYDSQDSFLSLGQRLSEIENHRETNRLFYMAIPPFVFLGVSRALKSAGLISPPGSNPWSRAVIEKPFGSDRDSSDKLVNEMAEVFAEDQTYRIDHYLGKEVVQNLMVLRFANLVFDPIWNRSYIDNIQITWMEDIGTEGRAGYFDQYGIIRDVMQNHLLQMMALVAMEPPISLNAQDVRDEKVKVLRAAPPLELKDLVVAQYTASNGHEGYLEEKGVPEGSIAPTFAAAVIQVKNRRWDGVPFLIRAGKGLDRKFAEIRIQFRPVPGNTFCDPGTVLDPNELVIRVQPDESVSYRIMNKVPGLEMDLKETDLNLSYQAAFEKEIPEAYESLILDVLEDDQSLFIRADELAAAWDIFTPALQQLERENVKPETYPFKSPGPEAANRLAQEYGVKWK